jgi:uncharacterized membrane protein HdeD (DUF308 family)
MSSPATVTETRPSEPDLRYWWLSGLLGVAAIAVGVAALTWPGATLRVAGFLFGLNLLVTGLVRAVLCLVVSGYPVLYRLLGVVFGVLTAVVGVICLRNVFASAVLLMVFVAIGWIFDGVVEIAVALAGADDPLRRWRITAGVLYLAAAVVVLVWPALSLKTFLSVGAVALIVIGVAQVAVTIGSARAARTHATHTLAGAAP